MTPLLSDTKIILMSQYGYFADCRTINATESCQHFFLEKKQTHCTNILLTFKNVFIYLAFVIYNFVHIVTSIYLIKCTNK